MVEEDRSETHVSAQQAPSRQAPRVPPPDVDARRPARAPQPPTEGASSAVGVIWRVRDQASFAALRQRGRRVREGPVTVTFLHETDPKAQAEPPKVAFAVGRRVGGAVRRNRVRRRLRSIMRELAGRPDGVLEPGSYLVGVRPDVTTLSYQELKTTVEAALQKLACSVTGTSRT